MSSFRSSISGDDALADVDALDEVVGDDAMDVEHLLSRYGGSSSSSSAAAVSAASSPRAPASMGVVGVPGVDDPLGWTRLDAQRRAARSYAVRHDEHEASSGAKGCGERGRRRA